ncbi:MAG TPA: enoyl-CoA hydratase-related protein [Thermoanaerobaculia bacterium]
MNASSFTRLKLTVTDSVARVTLARPEARNAFDDLLIAELARSFSEISGRDDVRAAVLSGEGPVFCAGADIAWMRRAGGYTRAENEADAEKMARMLRAIDACSKPVIALAHGAAIGGGVGLVAAADIAIASEETVFSLAEVKLGILPAVISPYVLRAIGPRAARDLYLTGDRFGAAEAHRIGLIHAVVPAADLESACERKLKSLSSSGPEAVRAAKALIEKVAGLNPDEAMSITVRAIAERRASDEAKEGLSAFLEKRPASWTKE